MSEMVERVARAIHEQETSAFIWEHTPQMIREHRRKQARAAIEAMRVPTEEMVDAGYDFTADPCWREDFVKGWQAMIDEALK